MCECARACTGGGARRQREGKSGRKERGGISSFVLERDKLRRGGGSGSLPGGVVKCVCVWGGGAGGG